MHIIDLIVNNSSVCVSFSVFIFFYHLLFKVTMKSNLTVLILLAMFIINDSSMYIIIFFKGKPSKIKIVIYLLILKLFQVVCRFLLSEVDILKTVGKKKILWKSKGCCQLSCVVTFN